MKKTKIRSFRLSEQQLELLQDKADKMDIPMNRLVAMILDHFLMGVEHGPKSRNRKIA